MRRPESEQGMSSLNLHESQLSSMDALPPRVEVNFYQVQFHDNGLVSPELLFTSDINTDATLWFYRFNTSTGGILFASQITTTDLHDASLRAGSAFVFIAHSLPRLSFATSISGVQFLGIQPYERAQDWARKSLFFHGRRECGQRPSCE